MLLDKIEARQVESGLLHCDFSTDNEDPEDRLAFVRVRFLVEGVEITYDLFLEILTGSQTMRTLLSDVLAGQCAVIPYSTFFWEVVPVNSSNLQSTIFEFVAIEASLMHLKSTNLLAFDSQFSENICNSPTVIEFMTPSLAPKQTNLVCPARDPRVTVDTYRSISSFFRGASVEQINKLLRLTANQVLDRIVTFGENANVWLSTAGYDVAWVHIRIDQSCKYYRYGPYKLSS